MRWSELRVDFTSSHHPIFLLLSSFLTSFIFHYLCQVGCVCTSACLFGCHQDYRKKNLLTHCSWNLVEGCSMGRGRTRIFKWISITQQIDKWFFTFINIAWFGLGGINAIKLNVFVWILSLKSNDKQEKSFWSVCDTQMDVFILASSLKFPSFTFGKILPVHPSHSISGWYNDNERVIWQSIYTTATKKQSILTIRTGWVGGTTRVCCIVFAFLCMH